MAETLRLLTLLQAFILSTIHLHCLNSLDAHVVVLKNRVLDTPVGILAGIEATLLGVRTLSPISYIQTRMPVQ